MKPQIDLTKNAVDGNWAYYLPAISGFFATQHGNNVKGSTFTPPEKVPAGFELGIDGLNFLQKDAYYTYELALFSLGHAERNPAKMDEKEPMIHKRDRKATTIVADSGGFQVATGVIKVDWSTFKTQAGDKLRGEILTFLEKTGDWSMTLDVPAHAAYPPLNKKTGLTKFSDALDYSIVNLDYFMKNRIPGKTKFLNVISGTSPEESKIWYDAVKKYSMPAEVEKMGHTKDRTLEGWAFAGLNMRHMPTTLNRLLDLIEDGLIADKDWIHFLGVGRLDSACFLTSIKRQLQKYNPNINISFDASSPFSAAGAYSLTYHQNIFTPDRFSTLMGASVDDRRLSKCELPMPFGGPIFGRMKVKDMVQYGENDLNKRGKIGVSSLSTVSYLYMMGHNVYQHITGIQEACRLADLEYLRYNSVSYKDWTPGRKSIRPISDFIPNSILFFNDFVNELFKLPIPDAREFIKTNSAFLESVSFRKQESTSYNALFGGNDEPTVDELEDADEYTKIDELEE